MGSIPIARPISGYSAEQQTRRPHVIGLVIADRPEKRNAGRAYWEQCHRDQDE
jgi:hypothetical protein